MTPEVRAQLEAVNLRINQIPYQLLATTVDEPYDMWRDTPVEGGSFPCRDYVMAKASALRDTGWDPKFLFGVLCWTERVMPDTDPNNLYSGRERHAVLGVLVDYETFILDSRFDDLYRWDQPLADYLWEHAQISGTTNWRDVSQTGLA